MIKTKLEQEKTLICHECGSSVANAEAFCPYCGIRLEAEDAPIEPVDESPVDESLESTIMMPPSQAAELAELRTGNAVPEPDPAAADTGPAAEAEPAIDEAPVPSLLSDLGKTEDNLIPSTSEFSAEEIAEGVQETPKTNRSEIGPSDLGEVEAERMVEPEIPADAVIRVSDDPSVDVETPVEVDSEGRVLDVSLPAAAEEMPEPPPPAMFEQAARSADAAPVNDELSVPAEADSIVKPGEDLSSFDSYASRSTFDSVRIMEPQLGDRADDVQTRVHPESERSSEPAEERPASNAVSSTSHNIGIGETDGKKSAKLKPLVEGAVLNARYEIIRKIGGGGMGAVYLSSDNNLGGVLRAVKEMVQTHIEEEQQEKAINDFKRESMILSSLDHVSIPTIYDYFYDEKESRFYLVMKYISGGDLSTRLRSAPEGRLDEKTVCEWAVQITDVLDYLHNQPSTIVYRDLKPSNIMVDANSGRAMLIDFGIARSISQKEEKGVTAVGTMGYAPPELFSGNVEPRSDIYSLGSTMFHLLTGADPQSNPLLIFDFQKNPRPRQINPQLSDQIERIMMKAVQYNSDQRFSTAAEMRNVLEDHLLKLKAGIVTYGVGEVPASVSLAQQSVFCGFCGQRIVATDMFCAFCGAKQPIAQQGVHSEVYSQTGMTARLLVEGTSELSAPVFSLQKEDNLLGRRDPMSNIFPEVDLSKYDPQTKISRRHARIWRDGTNYLLEDLGSSNGTLLTRAAAEAVRLVPKQPQVLSAGDRIIVGDATLHFVIG
ncbi:MAG: protein kinase [Acidobacteria bacterium]|nr:protein kinase [Acidobacteriota bacterium]